jgi:hypothetical protein
LEASFFDQRHDKGLAEQQREGRHV